MTCFVGRTGEEKKNSLAPATDPFKRLLRRVKGNLRREMIMTHAQFGDISSIPDIWKAHDMGETWKAFLQHSNLSGSGAWGKGRNMRNAAPMLRGLRRARQKEGSCP